jgi:hypothetical protein
MSTTVEEKVIDFDPFDVAPITEVKEPVIEEKSEVINEPAKAEIKPEIKEEPIVDIKKEEPKPEIKSIEEPFILDDAAKKKFYDETYEVLAQKKEIEKVSNLDLTKVNDAKRLLELNLRLKNNGLDADEVKEEIEEKYALPKQPKQKADEDTDEYQERLDEWKEKVSKIERRISRDAKQALPELKKINESLLVPEIPKGSQVAAKNEPSPEDVAEFNKMRSEYLTSIEAGVKGLNDFTFTAQDKDVPVTVTWKVEDAEKTPLQTRFTDFDSNKFLESRWVAKDGSFNGKQQAKDVYLLENFEKIAQKLVNDGVAQTKLHYEKTQKNIDLKSDNRPRGTFQPDNASESDKMAEFFFNN